MPTKLGELTAAVAEVLDTHTKALDLDDANARQEHAAYLKLAEEHRQTAAQLLETGEEMAGYRDLPVARHDPTVMSSAGVADTFENFVRVAQELLALLQGRVEQDRAMLREMAGGPRAAAHRSARSARFSKARKAGYVRAARCDERVLSHSCRRYVSRSPRVRAALQAQASPGTPVSTT